MHAGGHSGACRIYGCYLGQEVVCVIGNSQAIEENKELFSGVENLIQ